ncbi:DUF6879 family protein [Streptomyces sp. NPDC088725]|uniref:DUF6879 family protein n=1 Tax=Streptomyces sp. NPDC088725 TaxID=3365873 RepID=UPI003805E2C8
MPDHCPPALVPEQGERLVRADYKRDFRRREAAVRNGDSWKLERLQHFEEHGSASRDALRRGEWEEALRLMEERHGALLAEAEEDRRHGHVFHRVRVVEQPLTPYLQWELHSLRQQAQYGQRIRVVSANTLARTERAGLLPELVVVGGQTLYHVLYTEAGASEGAIRYTDPDLVGRWERYIKALYRAGEEMHTYFDREVSHLPAPKTPRE